MCFFRKTIVGSSGSYLYYCSLKNYLSCSVNEGYLTYTQFRALQHFSSAALSVLSTQVFSWVRFLLQRCLAVTSETHNSKICQLLLYCHAFEICTWNATKSSLASWYFYYCAVSSICCRLATYPRTSNCSKLGEIASHYILKPFYLGHCLTLLPSE